MGATLQRLAWFAGIWAASVLAVLTLGGAIRLILHP